MKEREIAIEAEGLSKCYRLGLKDEIRDSLVQVAFDLIRKPITNYQKYRSLYNFDDLSSSEMRGDVLWALRDASFEVSVGEKVGIIGRNGSGKSTLLKILSRITHPVAGRASVHGRVSSLLEVGTGFHPELTGRENIYLNGTILGMKKKEIDQRFDEIVEFSGVEKFLDTPVKRYSSGMRVRLAFSVAAHLEPEILIIDEVLAVGDSEFQNKCLNKMKDVGKSGRTVLFVSHNMGAILQLCERIIWLDGGVIKKDGPAQEVINTYLEAGTESHSIWRRTGVGKRSKVGSRSGVGVGRPSNAGRGNNSGNPSIDIMAACLMLPQAKEPITTISFNVPFDIKILYQIKQRVQGIHITSRISDLQGNLIFTSWDTDMTDWIARAREPGWYLSVCRIPPCILRPGRYMVTIGFYIQNTDESELYENVLAFNISEVGYMEFHPERVGIIAPALEWQVAQVEEQTDIINYKAPLMSVAVSR